MMRMESQSILSIKKGWPTPAHDDEWLDVFVVNIFYVMQIWVYDAVCIHILHAVQYD
jgi:hypothetical protein